MPKGSALSRRAIWLPCWVQEPDHIQQPQAVEPSARNWPKPASCSPARTSTAPVFGSVRLVSALPLYSMAISSALGSSGRA
ncbi:hypothetical protein D3C77_670550 [compost metagenome]